MESWEKKREEKERDQERKIHSLVGQLQTNFLFQINFNDRLGGRGVFLKAYNLS